MVFSSDWPASSRVASADARVDEGCDTWVPGSLTTFTDTCTLPPLPIAFAYAGFAMVGLGVAAGYPLGVSAVSALDETYQPANVAIMSTSALAGFLVGPPLIGFLGDAIGLQSALAVLGLKAMFGGAIASWLTATIAGMLL